MARYYDTAGDFIGEDGQILDGTPYMVDIASYEALERRAIEAERKVSDRDDIIKGTTAEYVKLVEGLTSKLGTIEKAARLLVMNAHRDQWPGRDHTYFKELEEALK